MKLRENPPVCPEGYTIDMYCRYTVNVIHDMDAKSSAYGRDRANARRAAKDKGWKLHRNGTATCPQCVRNGG